MLRSPSPRNRGATSHARPSAAAFGAHRVTGYTANRARPACAAHPATTRTARRQVLRGVRRAAEACVRELRGGAAADRQVLRRMRDGSGSAAARNCRAGRDRRRDPPTRSARARSSPSSSPTSSARRRCTSASTPSRRARFMERYYGAMRAAVEAHGGTVVKLLGDGVMAAFGVPRVAEDDAIRAVRAAVAMQEAFRALAERAERARRRRPACASPSTPARWWRSDATDVVGDPVNVAARLQERGARRRRRDRRVDAAPGRGAGDARAARQRRAQGPRRGGEGVSRRVARAPGRRDDGGVRRARRRAGAPRRRCTRRRSRRRRRASPCCSARRASGSRA